MADVFKKSLIILRVIDLGRELNFLDWSTELWLIGLIEFSFFLTINKFEFNCRSDAFLPVFQNQYDIKMLIRFHLIHNL